MIRRNVAGQVIYFPQLTTSDGTAVTSSATLTVAKDGSESASAGTLMHSANGVWKYTPTQAETDAAIVGLILTASGAVPVVLNLVTTGANTSLVAMGANTVAPDNASIAAILEDTGTTLPGLITAIPAVTVVPLSGTVLDRSVGTNINLFTSETPSVSIAVIDAQGVAVTLTGMVLTLIFEDIRGNDIATVADGNISRSGSTITFTAPSALTTKAGTFKWSLRNATAVLLVGFVNVAYAPVGG